MFAFYPCPDESGRVTGVPIRHHPKIMSETIPPPLPGSVQTKTSALAIWSLVLGVLSLVLIIVCIGPIFAIPAIICGHIACSRIKRSGGQLAGKGLAIAGFVTGYVSLASIVLLLPIAIPNFVKARDAAQMNACINNLRMIDAAKQQWALENNKKSSDTPTQSDLEHYLKNSQFPTCPKAGTYTIGPVGEAPACSEPKHILPQ
jgi:competence protein ComGC